MRSFFKTLKQGIYPDRLAFLVLAVFFAIFCIIAFTNHYFFRTYSFDYAAYNYAFYDYSHFRITSNPIYWVELNGANSFLQDHLSFLMFLLIPLYWILTPIFGTYTLLLIQNGFIIWGGWGVYKLIQLKTQNNFLCIIGLLLYFLTYGRYSAFVMDVNLVVMLAGIVPVYLYYFEKRSYKIALLLLIIILSGRENMPIWIFFIILVQIIWNKKNKTALRWAVSFQILAVLYFFVAFYILIPAIESKDHPFSLFNYSDLGKDPIEAALFLISHPKEAIHLLYSNPTGNAEFDGLKVEFYFVYLISGCFILIYRPYYLLFFFPIILQKMYNDEPLRWSIELYYSIEVVTLLPIAVALTIYEIKFKKFKIIVSIIVLVLASLVTIYKSNINNHRLKWYGTEKYKFFSSVMYQIDFDPSRVNKLLSQIPQNANVSACTNIAPHLAFRDTIYYYPRIDNAEYISIFKDRVSSYYSPENYYKFLNDRLFSYDWSVLADENPIIIIKKNNFDEKNHDRNDSIVQIGDNKVLSWLKSAREIKIDSTTSPKYLVSDLVVQQDDRIRIDCEAQNYDGNFAVEIDSLATEYFKGIYTDSIVSKGLIHLTIDMTINDKNMKHIRIKINPPSGKPVYFENLKIIHYKSKPSGLD